jgi:tetratricopeptide (TPR) repeat protein
VTQPDAITHLKYAYDLIKEVERNTQDLRTSAASHDASIDAHLDANAPFVKMMWKGFVGKRRVGAEKAELVRDLQLATSELEKAVSLDPGVTLETKDGTFEPTNTRAGIWLLYGLIEMIWGTGQMARQYLEYSLQLYQSPETVFWLAAVCESQYDAPTALRHFEKYLELDPNGEYSVNALRAANQLRNYRKRFRGDWTLLIISLLLCFPISIVYFVVKYK